jgi:hypothetical protein
VNNGHDSAFFNIVIVAEPAKLFDNDVGSLADRQGRRPVS